MWTPRYLKLVVILPLFCRAQQSGPDSPTLTFRAQTRLVLLPFHAARGKNYRRDLQASDVVLLEDGVRRSFTVFDSPATEGRMPLELVLLFDTNPAFEPLWDPAGVYRFAGHWEDRLWDPIFNRQDADVRISIYDTFGQKLYRLSPATTEPGPLTRSLNGLLKPILPGTGEDDGGIPLSLPPKRDRVGSGRFTWDFPTSPFIGQGARGWPLEAAITTMNEITASPGGVSRVLVMFGEGIGATTTVPADVGDHALDLGIPMYPIVTNYKGHVTVMFPRNLYRMKEFAALAKITGGLTMGFHELDAAVLQKLLMDIRHDGLTEYVVGFVPPPSDKPHEHKLEVKMASKKNGQLEGGVRRAIY